MSKRMTAVLGAVVLSALVTFVPKARAWDHPGHMITVAIAFAEIERARPELIDKIGLLFLKHPDPAPFWVAAGEAKGRDASGACSLNAHAGRTTANLREMIG